MNAHLPRCLLLAAITVMATTADLSIAAGSAAPKRTWIACRSAKDPNFPTYKRHPTYCAINRDIAVGHLHWHRWGQDHAWAHGRIAGHQTRIHVFRKRRNPFCSRDDHRFYTRLKIDHAQIFHMRPEWAACSRRSPL